MVLLSDDGLPTTFRYKLSGFLGERRAKSKIGDSCGNSKFVTSTRGLSPPNFEDIFSTPTEKSVPAFVNVSATDHSKTLLAVVVNTLTGEASGYFGLCLSVLDAPTTSATTGMFNSSTWEGCARFPDLLDYFMVRASKLPKCVLRSIVSFCSVDACVKGPFPAKTCFY